jgi:hypothetical protein
MRLRPIEFDHICALQSESIHAKTNANSVEISTECPIISELVNFAERFQESFLSNVFGFMSITKEVCSGSHQSHAMLRNEVCKRNFVTNSASMNPLKLKLCVFMRGWGCCSIHYVLPDHVAPL